MFKVFCLVAIAIAVMQVAPSDGMACQGQNCGSGKTKLVVYATKKDKETSKVNRKKGSSWCGCNPDDDDCSCRKSKPSCECPQLPACNCPVCLGGGGGVDPASILPFYTLLNLATINGINSGSGSGTTTGLGTPVTTGTNGFTVPTGTNTVPTGTNTVPTGTNTAVPTGTNTAVPSGSGSTGSGSTAPTNSPTLSIPLNGNTTTGGSPGLVPPILDAAGNVING